LLETVDAITHLRHGNAIPFLDENLSLLPVERTGMPM